MRMDSVLTAETTLMDPKKNENDPGTISPKAGLGNETKEMKMLA